MGLFGSNVDEQLLFSKFSTYLTLNFGFVLVLCGSVRSKNCLTLFYAESNPTYFTRGWTYMPLYDF